MAVATPPELALPEARRRVPLDEAVAGAHAIYTDVWVSMGDEDDAERRRELLAPYRLDEALLGQGARRRDRAALPARRTPARRSPRACSTASAPRSGTRPRTACTRRRRCWSCCLLRSLRRDEAPARTAARLLALALVAAGCGGDDDDDSGSGDGGGSAATAEEPGAHGRGQRRRDGGSGGTAAGTQVSMKDIKFNPGSVTIKAGEHGHLDQRRLGGPRRRPRDDFESGSPGGIDGGDDLLAHLQEGRHLQVRLQRAPGHGGDRQVVKG